MKLFNTKGMMLFPNPIKKEEICKQKNLLVVKECFCHNGHGLISEQAVFNRFNGIIIKVKKGKQKGLVALSPVYGYKTRVCLDVKLKPGITWQICCPHCNEPLPVFSSCSCKGDIVALFLNKNADFSNSILICNRIDCFNAQIKFNDEIIHFPGVGEFV